VHARGGSPIPYIDTWSVTLRVPWLSNRVVHCDAFRSIKGNHRTGEQIIAPNKQSSRRRRTLAPRGPTAARAAHAGPKHLHDDALTSQTTRNSCQPQPPKTDVAFRGLKPLCPPHQVLPCVAARMRACHCPDAVCRSHEFKSFFQKKKLVPSKVKAYATIKES
jgi:hypothetical protein